MRDCLTCEYMPHCEEIGRIYYGTASRLSDQFQDRKYAIVAPGRICPIDGGPDNVPLITFLKLDYMEQYQATYGFFKDEEREADIMKTVEMIAEKAGWK